VGALSTNKKLNTSYIHGNSSLYPPLLGQEGPETLLRLRDGTGQGVQGMHEAIC
jgi:hypothetical protein